jgi:ubiquitin carboxyl-terminal hydrolase L5
MSNEWCTIESDPGVFSELIEGLGVKDISVEEIITINDRNYLSQLEPIHGFIFLFRWDNQKPYKPDRTSINVPGLFFAKQVIKDNCATQALLSVLLNNSHRIDIGEQLTTFREFSIGLDPYLRGDTIGQSEHIRKVHNSFAKPDGFLYVRDPNDKRKGKKEDAFHFVAYTQDKNSKNVYEIDGLQEGPILLGSASEDKDWIDVVIQEVQSRMSHYATNEIRFTLLAVVDSPMKNINQNISNLTSEIKKGLQNLKASPEGAKLMEGINFDVTEFEDSKEQSNMIQEEVSLEGLAGRLNANYSELVAQKSRRQEEEAKKQKQTLENQRRKHNYIPFIFELLKQGVKSGALQQSYDKVAKK